MTVGMLMYYGGIAGAVLGVIMLMILSRVFAIKRKKKRESINRSEQN